jgi:hypothetical protein
MARYNTEQLAKFNELTKLEAEFLKQLGWRRNNAGWSHDRLTTGAAVPQDNALQIQKRAIVRATLLEVS